MRVQFDFSELNTFVENVTNQQHLDTTLATATQNIARVLYRHLVEQTPVKTGNLRNMWSAGDNLGFTVKRVNGGYEVTLINKAEYATSVNDGHHSYNQFNVGGEPYVVKNRTVP